MVEEPEGVIGRGSKMGEYEIQQVLGEPGDEGNVYKAMLKGTIPMALKYVDVNQANAIALETEIRLLSFLRHPNIVKINGFGFGELGPSEGGQLPLQQPKFYIAMDWVAGQPLNDAWRAFEGPTLVRVFDQLLDAVVYLHERGVLHMDLKPKNVLVDEETKDAMVIDLGFAVVADPERFKERYRLGEDELDALNAVINKEDVYVASTREYTREHRHEYLGKRVPRAVIRSEWYPDQDLFAIGQMIDEALQEANLDDWPAIKRGLQLVSERLVNGDYYEEASAVREDLRKLYPGYLAPMGIPELSPVADDGVYVALAGASVQLSSRIQDLIEHRFFQRLRNIPQLEFAHLLYPNATESRLPHSLLTLHLTRLAICNLLADVRFRLLVDRADIEATLIFALLHDIGHYPLSHMFEDFRGEQMPAEDPVLIDEELFSPFLTGGEEPAASGDVKMTAKVIKRMLSGELSLAEIISQSFGQRTLDGLLSIHRCADEGYSPSRTIHRMLAALVCSAIDIDKVAYLTADSSATGVPYGQGIDVHGFLTSLRTPIVALTTGSGPVLGVDEKGLAAVESVILARYWMVSRVYWHHTNRAVMAAFKFVISQLKEHGKLRFSDYFAETFWDSEVEAARRLSAHFNELEEVRANMLLNPIQGLIDGRRIIYKRLVTVSKLQEDDLYEKMVHRGEGPAISCAMEALEDFLPENERRRGSVLVDVPRTQRDSISLEEIRILSDPEAGGLTPDRPLGEASPLLKQLRTEFVNEAKKCRVLIDREAYQALEHQGKLEGVRKAIRERLSRGLA